MHTRVTLTILAVVMSIATLFSAVFFAVMLYLLRRRKFNRRTNSNAMVKPSPLPMLASRSLPQLKQHDYVERFYSDSEDSGQCQSYQWSTPLINEQLYHFLDEVSDSEYRRRRSSSALSSSSRDDAEITDSFHTPSSSASDSPIMTPVACILNLSLKYDFKDSSLTIVVINANSPPRQSTNVKCLLVVVQLFQKKPNGEYDDLDLIFKTDIKPYSTNVLFNDTFRYEEVPHEKLQTMSVRFSLCSHDRFSRVQTLGDFIVNLSEVSLDPVNGVVLQRRMQQGTPVLTQEKEKGELSVSLRYKRGSARINVIVLKATNLKKPKMFMSNDPYVTVKLICEEKMVFKKKTKVKKGSSNPCWNEPFAFELQEEYLNDYYLLFAVKCRDLFSTRSKLGTVCIGPKAQSTGETHWNDSVCSRNNTMRQVTMTHKLV